MISSLESSFCPLFNIRIATPIVRTAIIGQILARERMPKPSTAETALPSPNPIAKTNGTVTGPVVTPALSHATFTNSSDEIIVSKIPTPYNGKSTIIKSNPKMSFEIPSAMPIATPLATLYINISFLKAPLVNF